MAAGAPHARNGQNPCMGRRSLVLAVAVAALLAPAPAHAGAFLAGAAQQVTTPPPPGTPDAAPFGPSSALCPQPLFPNAGRFALEEPTASSSQAFCDANANGRWDGIYADNGWGPATGVHDPIDVRAVAISDGRDRPVVYASVDQIGIFDHYTEAARRVLHDTYHVDADLVVSADHNESSPDSIGLYGALQTPAGVGLRSGIDEYYMAFLEDRIARAAAASVRDLRPARLYANQVERPLAAGAGNRYALLSGLSQRISDQFPTSVALPGDDRVAAVDTKLGVLQARRADGAPIFTVMSVAAHNQEMGNSGAGLSADWPGAFERAFDATHAGVAMFLVGDNGSEEDPQTDPAAIPGGSENHSSQAVQWIQAEATGRRFAAITDAAARSAQPLAPGTVRLTRRQICVPLENNGFAALGAAGVFGRRQAYACDRAGNPLAPVPNGNGTPTAGSEFRTFVGYTDVGPDLQLIDNPGESFPALMLGSPFGVEDESCDRPNPAVPTWHARALYRFQVGLADDLIGYLIPAWGFASGTPGLFNNDTCYQDMHGHGHKLESESIGPTGSNDVANALAALLGAEPDPSAHVAPARFVLSDGSYSRWPTGAAGALVNGRLIGAPSTAGFAGRAVDANGVFMDYDGQPQAAPDLTTRGMMLLASDGCVAARYYIDVFPALGGLPALGRAVSQPPVLPGRTCGVSDRGGAPEIQAGAARGAGLRNGCTVRRAPEVAVRHVGFRGVTLTVTGRAGAFGCARLARVEVSVLRRGRGGACRYIAANGHLSAPRPCDRPILLLAAGRSRWHLRRRVWISRGRYVVRAVAIDTHGLRRAAVASLRIIGGWVAYGPHVVRGPHAAYAWPARAR
jgi:hypothetical protein